MVPAIEIVGLKKSFKNVKALCGLSFQVQSGSFFGLLGPNGAGKTTTIHVLTGLSNRDAGTVNVFGKDVTEHYIDCRKRIGFAPQEFNYDRFFTLQTLLEFSAGYFGVRKKKGKARTLELLERFGLIEKRNEYPDKLSGGMKRRLQLAKAMVHDPDILILDEPTAGADVELRYDLWSYFKDLNRAGKTILLTTHYLEEAEKLCDEIAIMNLGNIVEKGRTKELIEKDGRNLEEIFLHHVQSEGVSHG